MILRRSPSAPARGLPRGAARPRLGLRAYPTTRTMDNFILRLRKRFEPDPERPRYFHTVQGIGYRFTSRGEES